MSTDASPAPEPRFSLLRLIALYKIVKVLLLLLVAYGELRLRDASLVARLLAWASAKPYGLEHRMVSFLVEWFSLGDIQPSHRRQASHFARQCGYRRLPGVARAP
jgi:hypothetical protein